MTAVEAISELPSIELDLQDLALRVHEATQEEYISEFRVGIVPNRL
jgi:hypothetical protein